MKIIYSLVFLLLLGTPRLIHSQCAPVIPTNVSIIPFGATDSNFNNPG